MVTKHILTEYSETMEEIKILKSRIETQERRLQKIKESGSVVDMVSGGYGGTQHFKIEGVPEGTMSVVATQLERNRFKLQCRYDKLLIQENEVEDFISSLESSRARKLVDLRYRQGKSWKEVAKALGVPDKWDSLRKECEGYLKDIF